MKKPNSGNQKCVVSAMNAGAAGLAQQRALGTIQLLSAARRIRVPVMHAIRHRERRRAPSLKKLAVVLFGRSFI
jgi:hypothetical protein